MYEWIVAILVGLLGGIINPIRAGGFVKPERRTNAEGRTVYDPGFVGTIVVSVAAAFVAWLLSIDASFADKSVDAKPIATALLAGIGGSQVLSSYIDRELLEGVKNETAAALSASLTREESLKAELENLREELDRQRSLGSP